MGPLEKLRAKQAAQQAKAQREQQKLRETERRVASKEADLKKQVNAALATAIAEAVRRRAGSVAIGELRAAAALTLKDAGEAIRFLDELVPPEAAASEPAQPDHEIERQA